MIRDTDDERLGSFRLRLRQHRLRLGRHVAVRCQGVRPAVDDGLSHRRDVVRHTGRTQKLALTGQGAAKAFSDDQIARRHRHVGRPAGSEPTVSLSSIVAANPNLPYDASTYHRTPIGSTHRHLEHRKPQAGPREDAARARSRHAGHVHAGRCTTTRPTTWACTA